VTEQATSQGAPTGRLQSNDVVDVINPSGAGRFVLVCEHASNFVPADLNALGLSEKVLQSHIAWDPGALAVALAMSDALDAPLVAQNVSRLVYDCNRPPDVQSAVPETSEIYTIPGNSGLSRQDREARTTRYYYPFRDRLASCLDRQVARFGEPEADNGRTAIGLPVLVTIHSFTPVYFGERRDTEIGILHDTDPRLADALLRASGDRQYAFARNEPYGPGDGVTHTLVQHALPRRLPNVMIEVRNDLIAHPGAQQSVADLLCASLNEAVDKLSHPGSGVGESRKAEEVGS